jgi:hypothetical protein
MDMARMTPHEPRGTTVIPSTLLRFASVVLILMLAVMSFVRNVHRSASLPRDDAPAIVVQFSALQSELPDHATVCYAPVPHTVAELRLFQLARYALAPRILEFASADCRWIIGPDFRVKVR